MRYYVYILTNKTNGTLTWTPTSFRLRSFLGVTKEEVVLACPERSEGSLRSRKAAVAIHAFMSFVLIVINSFILIN